MLAQVDREGLAAVYREFYPRLSRFVYVRTGGSAGDVEDLVQETLLTAWQHHDTWQGGALLETWILTIARNKVADWFRARGRSERHAESAVREALARVAEAPVPPDLCDTVEMREAVEGAMSRLEADLSEVLTLRYHDGLAVRAIAGRLGQSESSVESRLVRAREALRRALGGKDV